MLGCNLIDFESLWAKYVKNNNRDPVYNCFDSLEAQSDFFSMFRDW